MVVGKGRGRSLYSRNILYEPKGENDNDDGDDDQNDDLLLKVKKTKVRIVN